MKESVLIPKDTIEAIKQQMDIVEVLSDFITLKKAGQSYKANSPFTNEKTPSFFVSPAKQIFKCFSSGKGGDSITFVMEHEGLSYVEALKYIAGKYGIEIKEKELTPEEIVERTERDSLFIALNFAKDHYKKNLTETSPGKTIGLSYFKERGFSSETIDSFDLGFTQDKWDDLYAHALKNQYSEDILLKAGLIIKKEDGKVYDRFRNRVMFPIHNLAGKVVAFGARILITDKKQPKYINSPETEVYHKSNVLYGIYQAKNEIRNKDNCYLVEGYTDVISLHQAGIKNVVASSGTALTKEQIQLIGRYTNNVTVLYDGDAAGIRASIRGIDLILEQDLNVYAVTFPEGDDPDSYVQKVGGAAFEEYLETNKQDFISFKTSLFLDESGDDPIKRAGIIRQIVESIALIPDPLKRSVYFQKCSQLLKIDEQVIVSEFNKIQLKKRQTAQKTADREKQNPTRQSQPPTHSGNPTSSNNGPSEEEMYLMQQGRPEGTPAEELISKQKSIPESLQALQDQEGEMIRLLLQYGNKKVTVDEKELLLSEFVIGDLEGFEFTHELYKEIYEIYKVEQILSDEVDDMVFLSSENQQIAKTAIDLISSKYEISEGWAKLQVYVLNEGEKIEKVAYLMINRLKWRHLRWMIKENLKQIEQCKDEEDLMILQKKHLDYKRAEINLAKEIGNVTGG